MTEQLHICHTWNRDHTRCIVCGVHYAKEHEWELCPGEEET